MNKTKVFDLPTRLFHWLFAGLFLGAFFLAKTMDDEAPAFAVHMLLGLVLAFVVGLRIVWGFVGSRYARFSSFALRLTGKSNRTLGHNRASSWAALIMMALALGLAVTGYFMTNGGSRESLEDLHELLANTFLIVAVVHVSGVIVHSLRHKDRIELSMVSGKKKAIEGQTGIERSHRGVALLFLAAVGAFVFHVGKNYDAQAQTVRLFGSVLSLGDD